MSVSSSICETSSGVAQFAPPAMGLAQACKVPWPHLSLSLGRLLATQKDGYRKMYTMSVSVSSSRWHAKQSVHLIDSRPNVVNNEAFRMAGPTVRSSANALV